MAPQIHRDPVIIPPMISATVQHALRALGQLSLLPEGEFLLGRELAQLADVPPSYLSKIMRTLGKRGFVEATRGVRGGYRLAREPEEIALQEVVLALEPDSLEPVCFLHNKKSCSNQEACPLHDEFTKVRGELESFLARLTLADMAPVIDKSAQESS